MRMVVLNGFRCSVKIALNIGKQADTGRDISRSCKMGDQFRQPPIYTGNGPLCT